MPRKRVLFVDDEPLLLAGYVRVVSHYIDGSGVPVQQAENGRAALDLVMANPDYRWCIFSDVCMPEMSGLDFFEALGRVTPHIRARKILISSSNVSSTSVVACGAERFIVKDGKPMFAAIRSIVDEFLTA
jgi:CheY-like chemotaxis protein